MCLKPENRTKEELAEQILKDTKELIDIEKESKLKENLYEYELIKLNSKTPLLDEQARRLIGITAEEYIYITKNYDKLIKKYFKCASINTIYVENLNIIKKKKFTKSNYSFYLSKSLLIDYLYKNR